MFYSVWREAILLNRVPRLPLPFFLFGIPPDRGVHDLGFHGLDDKDGWLLFADQHASHFKRIKRNIYQDELAFRRGGVPCLFATATNDQQMMGTLRVAATSGRKPGRS